MAVEHSRARSRQRGTVAIIVGLMLVILVGMGAFAIDLARWMVVKTELQNGVDAAALAGAGYLFPPLQNNPNWAEADTRARTAIPLNVSEKVALQTGTVTTGWWNFLSRSFDANTGRKPSVDELPAIRVSLARKAGENGGPVLTAFGRLFQVDSIDARATATAVVSVPGSGGTGALAPFAISQCMLEAATGYWDPVNDKPVGSPPAVFVIASGAIDPPGQAGKAGQPDRTDPADCNGCNCGQWTTFDDKSNSAATTSVFIQNGNPQPLKVGAGTYIQPGMKTADYGVAASFLTGKDIVVPVVDGDKLSSNASDPLTPVLRFACLRVVAVVDAGGSQKKVCSEYPLGTPIPGGGANANKCVIVRFATDPCKVAAGDGTSGVFTGAYVPPRLVQ